MAAHERASWNPAAGSGPTPHGGPGAIHFARAPDGTHLAYALSGSGSPLVTLAGPFNHLELDDEHPFVRPALDLLRGWATCLRYDERGGGLSDRGIGSLALPTRVRDLATVVDDAGLDRFALFAASDAGPVAIAYAAQHPERVTHLILAATFASGATGYGPTAGHVVRVMAALIRDAWGRDARLRRMVSVGLMPSVDEATLDWLDEHQPTLADASDVARRFTAAHLADASVALSRVAVPTLVVHAVDDPLVAFEEARRVAATIPAAQLQALDMGGHALPLHEELMAMCQPVIGEFLRAPMPRLLSRAGVGDRGPASVEPLSPREAEVIDLAARGLSNREIAEELILSTRTVERHLSNIYLKLGVSGTTARVAAVTLRLRDGGLLARASASTPSRPHLTG